MGETIDYTNLVGFASQLRLRQFRGTFWCTSQSPGRERWLRASFFGENQEQLQDDLKWLNARFGLSANETLFCIEADGRIIMRLSPHAANALQIHSVLPAGEAYRGYVDAMMQLFQAEGGLGADIAPIIKAQHLLKQVHEAIIEEVRGDMSHTRKRKKKSAAPETPEANEQRARDAGKGLANLIYFSGAINPSHISDVDAVLERVLNQVEREALYRCFPQAVMRTTHERKER